MKKTLLSLSSLATAITVPWWLGLLVLAAVVGLVLVVVLADGPNKRLRQLVREWKSGCGCDICSAHRTRRRR